MALRAKQQRFVEEYLLDLNARQAAVRAGYSQVTARSQGPALLRRPAVAAAVAQAIEARSARSRVTSDRVLEEMAAVAFSRLHKVVRWRTSETVRRDAKTGEERAAVLCDVRLADPEEMDETVLAALAEVSQTAQGGLKVRMHDKMAALNALARHLGLGPEAADAPEPAAPIDGHAMVGELAALPQEKRDALRAAIRAIVEGEPQP